MGSLVSLKEKINSKKVLLTNLFLSGSIAMANSYAANAAVGEVDVANIEDADKLVNSMLGIILAIARYVGIILVTWGIIQLLMAFRNEDADSKSRATMIIIASIALISAKSIVNLLIKTGGF